METSRFSSRKFLVTLTGMLLTSILAFTNHMDGNVAAVMSVAIGGYHAANAWVTGKGQEA